MSLRELSERFGAAPAAISNALKRNNLKRKSAPPGPRDKRPNKSKKKAAERLASLGLEPLPTDAASHVDGEAAEQPKAKKKSKSSGSGRGGGSRLEPYLDQIGKVIDREIAEKAGVSVSAVTNYRRRHGIPAATRRGGATKAPKAVKAASSAPAPAKAAPKAAAPKAAPAARASGSRGFRVTIGDEHFVVVADDIVEAARIASGAGRGTVQSLELLGQALGS